MSGTLTLQPNETAAVDRTIDSTATPSATAGTLDIGYFSSKGVKQKRAVMVWDFTSVPKGAKVVSASMTLDHYSTNMTNPQELGMYRITTSGVDENVTWTNYDGSSAWTTAGGDYTTMGATFVTVPAVGSADVVFNKSNFVRMINRAIRVDGGYMAILLALTTELDGTASGEENFKVRSASGTGHGGVIPFITLTYTTPSIASSRSTALRWTQTSSKTHTHQRYRNL